MRPHTGRTHPPTGSCPRERRHQYCVDDPDDIALRNGEAQCSGALIRDGGEHLHQGVEAGVRRDKNARIEVLAQRYLGAPYPWFAGWDQQPVIIAVTPEKINAMG